MSWKRRRDEGDEVENSHDLRHQWMTETACNNIIQDFQTGKKLAKECWTPSDDELSEPPFDMVLKFVYMIREDRKELNDYYDAQEAKKQKQQEEQQRQQQQHNYYNDNYQRRSPDVITRDDSRHWSHQPPQRKTYEERAYRHRNGN
tara:strand:+ start:180 stop:617 length:438 start_codon:yes stop_codon:yes gene_type:complete